MKTILSKICKGYTKNISLKSIKDNNGIYPMYGASGHIKDVDFFVSNCEYLGVIKDGAGVGRVEKYPAYSSLLGTMQYILPREKTNIDYLKYLLISLHLENGVSGAAIPHIYFKNYKNTIVNMHSMQEQMKIAHHLDLLSNSILIAKKLLFLLDELIKSRFIRQEI